MSIILCLECVIYVPLWLISLRHTKSHNFVGQRLFVIKFHIPKRPNPKSSFQLLPTLDKCLTESVIWKYYDKNVVAKFCEEHYESLTNKKGRVLGKKFQAGKFSRKNCQRLDLVTLDWHPLHFQILERQIYHTETTWNPGPFSWQEKNKLDFFIRT